MLNEVGENAVHRIGSRVITTHAESDMMVIV